MISVEIGVFWLTSVLQPATIPVRVQDNQKRPLQHVEVVVEGPAKRSLGTTSSAGLISIPAVEVGRALTFRRVGYQPERLKWSPEITIVTLLPVVRQLDQMRIVAPSPPSNAGVYVRPGESERVISSGAGFLGDGQLGDLGEIGRQFGGGSGESSFGGMPAGLSRISIAGAQTAAARLPRRTETAVILRNSPYDPAVGGFASAALEVELQPGSDFRQREVSAWNTLADVGGRAAPASTLSFKNRGRLGSFYVSSDADLDLRGPVAEFTDCRGARSAPEQWRPFLEQLADAARGAGFPSRCATTSTGLGAAVAGRMDRPAANGSISSLAVVGTMDAFPRTVPSALALSGAGAAARHDGVLVSLGHRDTTRADPRYQHRLALSASREARGADGPFVALESGGELATAVPPFVSIAGTENRERTDRAAVEGSAQARILTRRATVLTATAFGRLGTVHRSREMNPTISFSSLADLATGTVAEQRVTSAEYQAGAWSSVVGGSLGFVHEVAKDVRLLGGGRVDGITISPGQGAGEGAIAFSPRLAVEWSPERMTERGLDIRGANLIDQLGFGAVRVGIGRYVAWPDELAIADRSQRVLTPDTFSCGVGGDPSLSACPVGTGRTSASAPSYTLGTFRPVSNWRLSASAEYKAPIGVLSVDAATSLTTDEWLTRDANLGPATGAVDDGRPSYGIPTLLPTGRGPLPPSRLDPTRGFAFIAESRGRRSVSEVSIAYRPVLPDRIFVQLSGTVRRAARARSPIEWPSAVSGAGIAPARGVARWQAMLNASVGVIPGLRVTGMAAVQGGVPVFPVVSADVNGDGLANDPLYPYGSVLDAPTWELRQRACRAALAEQRQVCTLPPALTSWLQVDVGGTSWRYRNRRDRLRLAIWWANPLALALPHMIGVGQGVDDRVALATGYDAQTRRFQYVPNPAFLRRIGTLDGVPWRVGVNVVLTLHEDFTTQRAREQLIGLPSRPADIARVVSRYRRIVRNPWSIALTAADDIGLDLVQRQVFEREEARVEGQADSIWTAVVQRSLDQRAAVPVSQLADWQDRAIRDAWELMKRQRDVMLPLLTTAQRSRLPWFLEYLMTVNRPINLRLR